MKPAFPRSTAWWWFGCKDAPKGTIGNEITRDELVAENDNTAERDQHVKHYEVLNTFDDSGKTSLSYPGCNEYELLNF